MSGTMKREIIHEDDDCIVIHQPGNSLFSLVTFASLGDRPNGLWFWGEVATTKLGIDSFGIVAKSEHRYPREIIIRAAPAIRTRTKNISIGYGHSMGGYGALRNGRVLALTHSLALSPVNYSLSENFIDESLWAENYCPERNPGPFISFSDLAPFNLQIVDPFFKTDYRQAELFASSGRIRTIKVPFMEHDTIRLLRSTSRLMQIIEFLLADDFQAIGRLLNQTRRQDGERSINLARACLARGKRRSAEKLFSRALEENIAPDVHRKAQIGGLIENVQRLLSRNQHVPEADVLKLVEGVASEFIHDFRFQYKLSILCDQYGQLDAAAIPARLALECATSADERAQAATHLSCISDKQGRMDEAYVYACLAAVEKPKSVEAQRHVARIAKELGKYAEAESAYRQAISLAGSKQERAQVALELSHLLDQQGFEKEAYVCACLAAAEQPKSVEAQRHVARIAKELEKYAEAESAYRQALSLAGSKQERAQIALDLSHYLASTKRLREALEYAELALVWVPGDLEILLKMAQLRLRQGDRLGALRVIEQLQLLAPADHPQLKLLARRSRLIPFIIQRSLRSLLSTWGSTR